MWVSTILLVVQDFATIHSSITSVDDDDDDVDDDVDVDVDDVDDIFLIVILQCWSPPISRVLIAYSIITGTYYLGKSLEADGFWKCHDSVVACCSN